MTKKTAKRGRPRELEKPVHVGFQIAAEDLAVLQSIADESGVSLSATIREILQNQIAIELSFRAEESPRHRAERERRIKAADKAREARAAELEAKAARLREREAARRARREHQP